MSERPLRLLDEDAAWRAQLAGAARRASDFDGVLELTADERRAIDALQERGGLPLTVTPHFLSLMDPADPNDPLRLQVLPRLDDEDDFARTDPLGEEEHEAVPQLVHRYPDRVLLLATDRCASYCRFCTRKRLVGQGPTPTLSELDRALAYVAEHPEVKEVIVSGGDALMLDDKRLDRLLSRIREIEHVEIIRLATRMLAFAPQRVTRGLLDVVGRHHPVYVLSHFNHPRELRGEAANAVESLAAAGVPVLNQTVLLAGVNDDEDVLTELFRHLTRLRARPYYLHQCDLAPGTARFRVPLARAMQIAGNLRGQLSGISLPTLVIDTPGGNGKVPMFPSPVIGEDDESVLLVGSLGGRARYPKK